MHEKYEKKFTPSPTLIQPGFLMCHSSVVTRGEAGGGTAMSYTGPHPKPGTAPTRPPTAQVPRWLRCSARAAATSRC